MRTEERNLDSENAAPGKVSIRLKRALSVLLLLLAFVITALVDSGRSSRQEERSRVCACREDGCAGRSAPK